MTQTNSQIREEFIKEFPHIFDHEDKYDLNRNEVINWWLSKLDSLLKTQREELVERLSECAWCDLENGRGKYLLESDIKNLIKEQ